MESRGNCGSLIKSLEGFAPVDPFHDIDPFHDNSADIAITSVVYPISEEYVEIERYVEDESDSDDDLCREDDADVSDDNFEQFCADVINVWSPREEYVSIPAVLDPRLREGPMNSSVRPCVRV